jgi:hypothetical protein
MIKGVYLEKINITMSARHRLRIQIFPKTPTTKFASSLKQMSVPTMKYVFTKWTTMIPNDTDIKTMTIAMTSLNLKMIIMIFSMTLIDTPLMLRPVLVSTLKLL